MAKSSRQANCGLAILARAPELNKTKTRLAKDIGPEAALAAHVELVEHTLQQLSPSALACFEQRTLPAEAVEVSLWMTSIDPTSQAWADRYAVSLHEQCEGSLGKRMLDIVQNLHATGLQRICLVGTDSPPVDAAYVMDAMIRLSQVDVVVGPAEDGGYGLIGMQAPHPSLFKGVDWGTKVVFSQTMTRAANEGLTVGELAQVWDVDELQDWERFLHHSKVSV